MVYYNYNLKGFLTMMNLIQAKQNIKAQTWKRNMSGSLCLNFAGTIDTSCESISNYSHTEPNNRRLRGNSD